MLDRGFSADRGNAAGGAQLFQTLCASCHGPAGAGTVQSRDVNFTKPAWQQKMSDRAIGTAIRQGSLPLMPPFSLQKVELESLVLHLRSLAEKPASGALQGGY